MSSKNVGTPIPLSRKRIKDLKDAIRRRTIKLHSKVNSSSKGSRKVHKERKPQRTRRLNK